MTKMPNYNLANVKIYFSFEEDEEVLNLRLDQDTLYSAKCSDLPVDITEKLLANGLDFSFSLKPDFLYGLIAYLETGGRFIVDSYFNYKGLLKKSAGSNFIFEPKSRIKIPYVLQRVLQRDLGDNRKSFFLWADTVLSLLSFCEDTNDSLTRLLRVIQFHNNEVFVVGSLVKVSEDSADYLIFPQLTVAHLLAGQNCLPIFCNLNEFLPESLIATDSSVLLKQPSDSLISNKDLYAKLQQTLIDRLSSLNIELLPQDYQEVTLDTYNQEELDLEGELFYSPITELLYGL